MTDFPPQPEPQPAPQPGAGYPQPPAQAPLPQTEKTNTLAIVALIASFFVSLAGIICGHIALSQIKRTGEKGRGLALAGTIIGYVSLALTILGTIAFVSLGLFAASLSTSAGSSSSSDTSTTSPVPTEETTDDSDASTAAGEYSAEFCDALLTANGSDVSVTNEDGSISDEAVAIFEDLASYDSPNQEVYERFAALMKDPASALTEDVSSLTSDYSAAVYEDVLACS